MPKNKKYIDFNDDNIPIGKRKVEFVKWAMKKGTSLIDAQRIANSKFGFEKKEGIYIEIMTGDPGVDVGYEIDTWISKKYKCWQIDYFQDKEKTDKIKKWCKKNGWEYKQKYWRK